MESEAFIWERGDHGVGARDAEGGPEGGGAEGEGLVGAEGGRGEGGGEGAGGGGTGGPPLR